jgi:hypothetical protein
LQALIDEARSSALAIRYFRSSGAVWRNDGFSVGMLFAFMSFRQTLSDRAIGLINQAIQFRLLRLHLDCIADIATAAPEASGAILPALEVKGGVDVVGVSFRYGAADPLVLEDLSLAIAPDDFIAITGGSWSCCHPPLGSTSRSFLPFPAPLAAALPSQDWRERLGAGCGETKPAVSGPERGCLARRHDAGLRDGTARRFFIARRQW